MSTGGKRTEAEVSRVLRVADVLPADVGEHVVRIPADVMAALDLVPQDVVEVAGRKTTVVRVAPLPSSESQSVARMESIVRQNAGTGLDECVTLRPTAHQPARTLVLTATDEGPGGVGQLDAANVASQLNGMPVVAGDSVAVTMAGLRPGFFEVLSSAPQGPVTVNPKTKVVVADADQASTRRTRASYQDIGGLDDEVHRIREMVELPIRFPQLFQRLGIEAPKGSSCTDPPAQARP